MEVVAGIAVVIGAAFTLVAAIGVHRFHDVFARVHAAGKGAPVGAALVFIGVGLRIGEAAATTRLVLAILLLSLTFPVGVHMVLRAAHRSGTELRPGVRADELAEAVREGRVGGGELGGDAVGDDEPGNGPRG